MISKKKIQALIDEKIEGTDFFMVELRISSSNVINVEIDRMSGMSISDCVDISRQIEFNLDREEQDFELKVSSPGIDKPLRVKQQYVKNIDRNLKVILQDDSKVLGKLLDVKDDIIVLVEEKKIKKQIDKIEHRIKIDNIKEAKIKLAF